MNKTDTMLRRALKKIDDLEKRISELEREIKPKIRREPVEVTRDGDGKLLSTRFDNVGSL
mgnify:CR=1 FL=1|tara:strand:+ start:831 stop:1010 length:180 start_codon:yes stop_codon:yes gene_type:complete